MTVIPTRVVKHRHIPTPGAVGHCIFGFFIIKGGQINLYPKASFCQPWLAVFLRNSHLVWMLRFHSLFSSTLFPPKKGKPSEGFLGNCGALWHLCLLQPWLLYCEWMLHQSAPQSVSIIPFQLPIRDSLQALYPLLDTIGHSWSPEVLFFSPWLVWPPGLHFLLYHSLDVCMVTVFLEASICVSLLAQLNGPPKPNAMFLAPYSWIAYQRTAWSPLETGPWLWSFSLLARPPGVCWWSNILPTHGAVGIDCLLHLPTLLSPEYNGAFCPLG